MEKKLRELAEVAILCLELSHTIPAEANPIEVEAIATAELSSVHPDDTPHGGQHADGNHSLPSGSAPSTKPVRHSMAISGSGKK